MLKHLLNLVISYMKVKHSCSPWSSPCLLVPKVDGLYPLCTDYWRINAITVPNSYPLPRIQDCIDNVGSAHFVSKLDLLKVYLQVPIMPWTFFILFCLTVSAIHSDAT